jgi:hypothetical protein
MANALLNPHSSPQPLSSLPILGHAGQCSHFLDLSQPPAVNYYREAEEENFIKFYAKVNTLTMIL